MLPNAHSSEVVSRTLVKRMKARVADPRVVYGLPWGFVGLDKLTGGIHSGEMSIVMARPGVGKSLFAGQVALSVAEWLTSDDGMRRAPGKSVKIVTLEMTKEAFQDRLVCGKAGLSQRQVMSGMLNDVQQQQYEDAAAYVGSLPIEYLDETTGFRATRDFIVGEGQHKDTRPGVWWLLDYITLHPAEGADTYDGTTKLSKQFTKLAKREVPGLLVAQMNRSVESSSRKDKHPVLSDLRGSGQLEQDGSGPVMGLYRPDLYGEDATGDALRPKPAELVVLKQRNGPIGTIELMWLPRVPAYVDVSEFVDEVEASAA